MDMNLQNFRKNDVVADYVKRHYIQEPEAAIYRILKDRFPEMDMLDVGVGAGRTTPYFLNTVETYMGIDYSSEMIEACKLKFPRVRFRVGDIRTYEFNERFDFILFSFNGIDCMFIEEREAVLSKFYSLLNPCGYLTFSSHNVHHLKGLENPDYAIIDDGSHGGGIMNCYIQPKFQVKLLEDAGFENIRIFDLQGNEVKDKLDSIEDCWLYYLGRKR